MSRTRNDSTTPAPADGYASKEGAGSLVLESLQLSPEFLQPLTSTQVTAADLYNRGLNVFPIPRPDEVRAWAMRKPGQRDPSSKPPYINRPLFMNQLHMCGEHCRQRLTKSGRQCLPEYAVFEALFERANIAVMLGRTSGNLMAIDCDTRLAFLKIGDELNNRSIPYWAYTSHRGGGYLMRLSEGEAKNLPKGGKTPCPCPDVEIFGNRHYVVLPPSLHPAGTFYQWVPGSPGEPLHNQPPGEPPPLVRLAELEWLGVCLAKKSRRSWEPPELVDGKPWTARLSRNNRRILSSALLEGTRNINLTKPTYDIAALINEGEVGYEEGLQLLLEAADRCGYPADSVRQMLRSALRKPGLTPAVESHRQISQPLSRPWQKALAFAQSWRWTGRTAQSDRAVFLACIERALLDDHDLFRCSKREIAEIACCSQKTALNALRRLRGDIEAAVTPKVLKYVCRDIQSGACMYSFAEFPDSPSICTPLPFLVVRGGVSLEGVKPITTAEKDLFGRQKVAWRVWYHLCRMSEPSKAAIARATRQPWSSVSRALHWLMQLGLVVYSDAECRYYGEHLTDEALGEIVKSLGLSGRSEKRHLYHELERQKRINLMLARARESWSRQ